MKENRRIKFFEILLLLLRTLLFLFILLFFLSPYFGKTTFNRDLSTKTYIYIDNSNSSFSGLEEYKLKAKDYISKIDDFSNLYVRDNNILKQLFSKKDCNRYIDNLSKSLTQVKTDILISEIDSIFGGKDLCNREIFFFTDGFTGESKSSIEINRYGSKIDRFAYIDTMSAKVSEEGLNIDFRLNSNNRLVENGRIKLNINGKIVSNRSIEPFRGNKDINYNFNGYKKISKLYGYADIETNQKSERKYFTISKESKIDLLLVGKKGSESVNSLEKGLESLSYDNLNIELKSYKNFQNCKIDNYDIVIVDNSGFLDNYSINKLKKGSLSQIQLIFYGRFEDLNNRSYFNSLIKGVDKEIELRGKPIDWIDHRGEIFKGVFESKKVIESSKVFKMVSHKDKNYDPILKVNGNNLLSKERGKERYFVATSLSKEWSNLNRNGIIIPILDNLIKIKDLEVTTNRFWYYPNQFIEIDGKDIITPGGRKLVISDRKFKLLKDQEGYYRDGKGNVYSVNSYPDMRLKRYNNYRDYESSDFRRYLKKFDSSSYEIEIIIIILLLLIFELLLSRSKR